MKTCWFLFVPHIWASLNLRLQSFYLMIVVAMPELVILKHTLLMSQCVCMVAVWYVTLYAIAWCYGIDDVGVMGSPMVSILEEVIEFMIAKLKYHNSEEDKDEDASKSRS
ncbi:hypothetical protein Droror1_Dr00024977 [Drosera rotundifolia]